MNNISWNVRGLGGPGKKDLVRDFIDQFKPSIVCFQESKLAMVDRFTWRSISGNTLDCFCFAGARGTAGGMIVGWSSALFKGKLISSGTFCLTVEFFSIQDLSLCHCTTVYGPNAKNLKADFWPEIRNCKPPPGIPWIICGDFNAIFSSLDKNSGNVCWDDICDEQDLIRDLDLVETRLRGRRFTWTNNQLNPTWVRLDRFLVTPNWLTRFPRAHQFGLPRFGSDHVPICLELGQHAFRPTYFKFQSSWYTTDDFTDKIKGWWDEQDPIRCGAFIIAKKLLGLKKQFKLWAKLTFGSIRDRKRDLCQALDDLDVIQESRPLNGEELGRSNSLTYELTLALW